MSYLNIASVRECTESEGPGKRFALWCQGCLKRCAGCCNPEMQPLNKNIIVSVDDITALIQTAKDKHNIEGVSFIGGEPFLQSRGLLHVAKWCRANNLSILIFTGYLYEELSANIVDGSAELLLQADMLIDGAYIEDAYETNRQWVGSANQRVLYLTPRYKAGIELMSAQQSMELNVYDKTIAVNGWPFEMDMP